MSLVKATLTELDAAFKNPKSGAVPFEVQFNPESLKVTFANAIEPPKGGDQSSGAGGQQFVGAGSTKLALQLWFDVNSMEKNPVDDVRKVTKNVIYFMTPQQAPTDPKKKVPPGVRFQFGTFIFDGIVESLEETIDFFSPDGKALRSSISLSFTKQEILEKGPQGASDVAPRPGIKPLVSAKQGDSVQNIAAKNGIEDWQSIAAANGIEDPMRLPAGALLDIDASVSLAASASLGGSFDAGLSAGGSFDVGLSANGPGAAFGGGASLGGGAALGGASFGASGPNASLGGAASASLSIG
jgi:hypothetical protein